MKRYQPKRSTPQGEHRPVLLDEVLQILALEPGMNVVDCTVGWAGHSAEILTRIGPTGLLIGLDLDAENLPKARARLEAIGHPFQLHHSNFAGLQQILAASGLTHVDALLADLGMSSMQVDDAERGFSYVRDGALDMRMDRSRGRTAQELLAAISKDELIRALQEYGDEPQAERIAAAIIHARESSPLATTKDLARVIQDATAKETWRLHPTPGKWNLHPAARTFQALRILLNRELANLGNLLRVLPQCLRSQGCAALISFHSGEDRIVKAALRSGREAGHYEAVVADPVRASYQECGSNPRSALGEIALGSTLLMSC